MMNLKVFNKEIIKKDIADGVMSLEKAAFDWGFNSVDAFKNWLYGAGV